MSLRSLRGPEAAIFLPGLKNFTHLMGEWVLKNKKKESEFRLVKSVRAIGKEMDCHNEYISVVLGRPLHSIRPYEGSLLFHPYMT